MYHAWEEPPTTASVPQRVITAGRSLKGRTSALKRRTLSCEFQAASCTYMELVGYKKADVASGIGWRQGKSLKSKAKVGAECAKEYFEMQELTWHLSTAKGVPVHE